MPARPLCHRRAKRFPAAFGYGATAGWQQDVCALGDRCRVGVLGDLVFSAEKLGDPLTPLSAPSYRCRTAVHVGWW